MIVGIGTDIISVTRLAQMCEKHGHRFTDRVFTAAEQETAGAGPGVYERLAARFAAKEAVMKALGTGWARGVNFLDIEVVTEPSGRPTIRLTGEARARADRKGASQMHLSLSHEREHAIAFVILEGCRPVETVILDSRQPPAGPPVYAPEGPSSPLQCGPAPGGGESG
jgi:holo-[acyl-carrier protein] synthase